MWRAKLKTEKNQLLGLIVIGNFMVEWAEKKNKTLFDLSSNQKVF